MKKILIISFSEIENDPRVSRQIHTLKENFHITVVGFGNKFDDKIQFCSIKNTCCILTKLSAIFFLITGLFNQYYWSRTYIRGAYKRVKSSKFDVIIANDLNALPLALKISQNISKVIFDAHEYAPREFEDILWWRLLFQKLNHSYCKKYLPKVSGMMTVCQGIADEYARNFGANPVVVTNAPSYRELSPLPVLQDAIRMIHHGGAMPSRHLEDMIDMMDYLDDRFTLDFMLVPSSKKYLDQLKVKASPNSRIRFIETVPMQEIPTACNHYDIGVFLLRPVNFNYKHALPNKLFEFVQGRLAVAIGPSPEMARLVEKYNCGVVADSFSPQDLAAKLNALTSDQIQYFKNRSHEAAKELCAEANAQIIIDLVEGVS